MIAINLQALELINASSSGRSSHWGPEEIYRPTDATPLGAMRPPIERICSAVGLWSSKPCWRPLHRFCSLPDRKDEKIKCPGTRGTGVLEGIDARLLGSGAAIDLTGPSCDDLRLRIWIAPITSALFEHIKKKEGIPSNCGHTLMLFVLIAARYWIATSRSFNCSLDNPLNSAGKRPLPI